MSGNAPIHPEHWRTLIAIAVSHLQSSFIRSRKGKKIPVSERLGKENQKFSKKIVLTKCT